MLRLRCRLPNREGRAGAFVQDTQSFIVLSHRPLLCLRHLYYTIAMGDFQGTLLKTESLRLSLKKPVFCESVQNGPLARMT